MVRAQRVDREARVGKRAVVVVHPCGQHGLLGSGAAEGSGPELQFSLTFNLGDSLNASAFDIAPGSQLLGVGTEGGQVVLLDARTGRTDRATHPGRDGGDHYGLVLARRAQLRRLLARPRNLTHAEWRSALPNRAYRPMCPDGAR